MATTNIFNDLANTVYGAQDNYRNKNTQHPKLKCDGGVITEIPYKMSYDGKYNKTLEFVCSSDRYFNCLKLKSNKLFNDVFKEISFYIGGNKIISFDNSEYIEIIKKLKGNYEDDDEYIYLPFLFENNKMCTQTFHTIQIKLKTKIILNENDIKLKCTTYKRDVILNENFENQIIQLQKQNEILLQHNNSWLNYMFNYFGNEVKQVKINLMFNHPVFAIYILGKGIKRIKLQLKDVVYETTLTNLLETNKKNGYDFDFPVIIFEPLLFFDKNSKTINLSRIDQQNLIIEYTGNTEEFNVYAINSNILRTMNEMSGLAYSS
jgi:hypothetical protein